MGKKRPQQWLMESSLVLAALKVTNHFSPYSTIVRILSSRKAAITTLSNNAKGLSKQEYKGETLA